VSWKAWHRQPPKSISLRGQLRQGSLIQSVPRNRLKAAEAYQMAARVSASTLGQSSPGMTEAAGHGITAPLGPTTSCLLPQPFMHGLGTPS
jgi:hypothetical protein